jgi:hypothetical protein
MKSFIFLLSGGKVVRQISIANAMTRTPADPPEAKPPKSIARWVAGVVAVFSGAATIYGLFSDKRVAVFAFIGMMIAIVLLLVVQRAIRAVSARDATFYDYLVKGLVVFVLLYFMALTAALFPFLYKWLTNPNPGPPVNPAIRTPTPVEGSEVSPTPQQDFANLKDACKPETQDCTVFVFDYFHDQIGGDELQAFQNYQTDRLDKGIRNHLQGLDLLKGIDFHVARCSAATIRESSLADRAIKVLKVPAIMWGFIKKRPDNKLVSTTTITLLDDHLRQLGSREEFGDDITELLGLAKPVRGNSLAIATLIVGDVHLKAGKIDFARKAFLHAKELVADVDAADQNDFLTAVNNRLQQVETQNPASALRPIAGH